MNMNPLQRPGGAASETDFFVTSINVSSIAAAATSQQTFNIESDADFLWQFGSWMVDITSGAAQTDSARIIPLIKIQLSDTGSGRQLFNQALPLPLLFGNGGSPLELPVPRIFKANATVRVDLTNYSSGTTYTNLFIGFMGRKIFKY